MYRNKKRSGLFETEVGREEGKTAVADCAGTHTHPVSRVEQADQEGQRTAGDECSTQ